MRTDTLTRVNGLEVAYRAHGAGPTLILLHAFPFSQRMWDAQVEALADRTHVVTLDLPGFGASQATDGEMTIDGVADLVADFATKLGHDKFVLGGLSMGGYIALALARRHPARLRGLILADTKAPPDTPEARARRMAQIAEIEHKGLQGLASTFPNGVTTAATHVDRPHLLEQMRSWIAGANREGVTGALRMLADRPDARPGLADIRVPTLVIVGEADETTPPAEAEALAQAIPDATLVRLPAAGHIANLEQPQAFNDAVAAFMARFR